VHDKTRSRYAMSKDAHLVAFASILSCEFCNKPIVYTAAKWLGFLSLGRGLGLTTEPARRRRTGGTAKNIAIWKPRRRFGRATFRIGAKMSDR